ncbi:hypothetical protein HPG69_008512, partial [Diceros bicornis minor]
VLFFDPREEKFDASLSTSFKARIKVHEKQSFSYQGILGVCNLGLILLSVSMSSLRFIFCPIHALKSLVEEVCYSCHHFVMAIVRLARGSSDLADSLLAGYIYKVDT